MLNIRKFYYVTELNQRVILRERRSSKGDEQCCLIDKNNGQEMSHARKTVKGVPNLAKC